MGMRGGCSRHGLVLPTDATNSNHQSPFPHHSSLAVKLRPFLPPNNDHSTSVPPPDNTCTWTPHQQTPSARDSSTTTGHLGLSSHITGISTWGWGRSKSESTSWRQCSSRPKYWQGRSTQRTPSYTLSFTDPSTPGSTSASLPHTWLESHHWQKSSARRSHKLRSWNLTASEECGNGSWWLLFVASLG